jgi:hypothetical protein
MMEAKSSGQMGHPAAWMIANNCFPCMGSWVFRAWTLSNLRRGGNFAHRIIATSDRTGRGSV